MAQFLRPNSNLTQTNFTGGFAEIDEATASDADFAYGANNTAAVLEVGLSDPATTPDPAGTSTVRYRIAKTNNGTVNGAGSTVTVTAAVYQGGTLIQANTAQTATGTWTNYDFTFTHGSISDWTDIRLLFTTSSSGGSPANRRGGAVSWAEIEAPDATPAAYTLPVDPNNFTLTGNAAQLARSYVITGNAGTFALAGNEANLAVVSPKVITAEPSAFTLTGNNATLEHNSLLTADVKVFTVGGVDAGVKHNVALGTSAGSFSITGNAATLTYTPLTGQTLAVDTGPFLVTGVDANVRRGCRLVTTTGAIVVSPVNTAIFGKTYRLIANTRAIYVNGIAANIIYSGSQSTEKVLFFQSVVTDPHKTLISTGRAEDQLVYYIKGFYRIL